ncbi:MAG: HlyD family efflux transporter periplasmic adaptor subunit [Candidatus Omnitrophota bacterium]
MTQKETHAQQKEPALFEEKKEPPRKGKAKFLLMALAVLLAAFFWPKPVIKGEAILQAERFARIGLSSPGVLKELLHQKGDRVKQGEVIARFENLDIKQRFEAKKLSLEILRLDKDRLAKKVGFLTLDKDRSSILLENGVIARTEHERRVHELEEAEQEISIKAKEMESAEAEIGFLKTQVEALELKAPFDGILLTDPGDQIGSPLKEGEFVLEFADPDTYFLEMLILEKMIRKVSIGDPVQSKFNAFRGKTFTGEVIRIAPRARDEVEKVFKIKHVVACAIRLKEMPSDIKYGMRADAEIAPAKDGWRK